MKRLHWIVVGALLGGLVASLFMGWKLLLSPQGAAYTAKMAEKDEAEKKLQEAKQRAAQFEKFQAEAENVRRDLEFYTRRLDEPLSQEQLVATVQGMVNTFNLKDATVDLDTKPGKSGGDSTTVTLGFKGDLEDVGLFMNECVSQPHIFLFDSLDLLQLDGTTSDYRNSVDVKLVMEVLGGKGTP